ncbi:MAG: S4 domain-containing protein [Cypionkella sp.]|nr:S4 domain-containing protein [Cypionkella sp.]
MAGPSGKTKASIAAPANPKLRLDKWLFAARFFKSRELASALIEEGHLRLNGQPCAKPAHGVGAGDVLTFRARRAGAADPCFGHLAAARPCQRGAEMLYLDLDQSAANPTDLT